MAGQEEGHSTTRPPATRALVQRRQLLGYLQLREAVDRRNLKRAVAELERRTWTKLLHSPTLAKKMLTSNSLRSFHASFPDHGNPLVSQASVRVLAAHPMTLVPAAEPGIKGKASMLQEFRARHRYPRPPSPLGTHLVRGLVTVSAVTLAEVEVPDERGGPAKGRVRKRPPVAAAILPSTPVPPATPPEDRGSKEQAEPHPRAEKPPNAVPPPPSPPRSPPRALAPTPGTATSYVGVREDKPPPEAAVVPLAPVVVRVSERRKTVTSALRMSTGPEVRPLLDPHLRHLATAFHTDAQIPPKAEEPGAPLPDSYLTLSFAGGESEPLAVQPRPSPSLTGSSVLNSPSADVIPSPADISSSTIAIIFADTDHDQSPTHSEPVNAPAEDRPPSMPSPPQPSPEPSSRKGEPGRGFPLLSSLQPSWSWSWPSWWAWKSPPEPRSSEVTATVPTEPAPTATDVPGPAPGAMPTWAWGGRSRHRTSLPPVLDPSSGENGTKRMGGVQGRRSWLTMLRKNVVPAAPRSPLRATQRVPEFSGSLATLPAIITPSPIRSLLHHHQRATPPCAPSTWERATELTADPDDDCGDRRSLASAIDVSSAPRYEVFDTVQEEDYISLLMSWAEHPAPRGHRRQGSRFSLLSRRDSTRSSAH